MALTKSKKKKPAPKKHAVTHKPLPSWTRGVPPALLTAINNASKKYHVPPDLLAGIWRIESGGTYPNPAVNSSGYGGLFGTRLPYGSTQAQADLAASILANGLKAAKGNISEALSYYNSGRLTGGYTHVPGQVSSGVVPGYGGNPSGKQTSFLGEATGVGTAVLGAATNPAGAITGLIGSGASAVGNATGIHPEAWVNEAISKGLDALAIVGGGFVFVFGFVLVAADIGLSTKAGKVAAAVPAGRYIAKAARTKSVSTASRRSSTPTASAGSSRAEERREERHAAALRESEARTKRQQAAATEARTRQKNRRKTAKEQTEAERKAYYRGATDAASPTVAKIRKNRGKKKST